MKNRTVIGIVCIVLAIAVTFVVSPLVNKIADQKTEVVRFTADVGHGVKIAEEHIELVEISKAALPDKTLKTKQFYVSEVGLTSLETAFTEMMNTKKWYNKKDGNLGYHIIQSFAPGEGTPELIHAIGVEFVKRAFSGYEAVVATHLNTDCLHNHIVINAHNSEKDGRRSTKSLQPRRCRFDCTLFKTRFKVYRP